MKTLKLIGNFIVDLLGFRNNSKYVRNYMNDANIRSSIYMAAIIIILEIWMIIRQFIKYIGPKWDAAASKLELIFTYTSLYWLFIMCSIAMIVFAINYLKKKYTKKSFIANLVVGVLCILWTFLLIPEKLGSLDTIGFTTTLLVYLSMPIFGIAIISYTLFRYKKQLNDFRISIVVISCFALVCLLFGIKVGYSDFAHIPTLKDGVINIEKVKMITCFFTMVLFVACLLIWKPYISIILLTGIFVFFGALLNSYGQREFLEADRINYITFLVALVLVTVSIYQQRVTEARTDEELIHTVQYDGLLDIHNIRYMVSDINEHLAQDQNYCSDKIYLFVNVYNFKIINSQRGFDAGDEFLKEFAKGVQEAFPNEPASRQADDHFVILTKKEGYMERIHKLDEFVKKEANGLFVSLKVGGYSPKPGEKSQRSIDKARYACTKISHRYEVTYLEYDEKLDQEFNKFLYIVNHLDEAIENGYVRAYYQPVVWGNDNTLCGAEALARWIDPIYGFLSPADFIPTLENSRLIHKLDTAIIEYVCKNMREAFDSGRHVVPVSINFSRLDFELMDVKKEVDERIKKYNIDKEYIHIEVTESALSENLDLLTNKIRELKDDGYAIWLDDFGSGYSSLNVLKDFEFDVIKIDMAFLKNFESNPKTKDILECIINLSDKLKMKTLTEGVETREQADFLREIGCGRLQGYLFGKPMNLDDFEEKINKKELVVSNHII